MFCLAVFAIVGVRRLYTGLYHDGYRLMSWGTHAICRSILFALPCPPTSLAGLAHFPVPWYFLSDAGVRLEWRAERPLYRGREVADQPPHALVM